MRPRRVGIVEASVVLLVCVSLVLSAFFCAFPWSMTSASSASTDSVEVRRQIDAGNAAFVKAWMTGDANLFASCFAVDGALFRGGGEVVSGRDAIRARMKGVFDRYCMTEGTITTTGMWVMGDTAFETGRWNFAIGPVGESAAPDSGHFVEIWKLDGQKWSMWRDIGVPK